MQILEINLVLYFFQGCVSGSADLQDISGLAISGQKNFENWRLAD
jgi:hypothetical protein